jgi:hypothetical protein
MPRRNEPSIMPWVLAGVAAAAWYLLKGTEGTQTTAQLNQELEQGPSIAPGVTILPGGSTEVYIPAGS